VSKLNSGGSALVYSTYLGGSNSDYGQGIAVDSSGNAYVTGYTFSGNFPTTAGALQTTFGGGTDVFVSKFKLASVTFSSFSAKLSFQFSQGGINLNSAFTLGTGNNGISPLTEPVALRVGNFSTTIPAGSFELKSNGSFIFVGTIKGVSMSAKITPQGGDNYTFQFVCTGANLTGIVNPVSVTLTIGDDTGTTSVIF
jgi:hypothetical protein